MPIRRELRSLYPAHWSDLSRRVRFERAGGICQGCGRPHDATVRCLSDGRWYDPTRQTWRDRRGRIARWPDLEQMVRLRTTRVVLAAAHLDHDPTNNRLRKLRSLCQRCHLSHDRPHHLAQRRITYLLRRALGDLFLGPYGSATSAPSARRTSTSSLPPSRTLTRGAGETFDLDNQIPSLTESHPRLGRASAAESMTLPSNVTARPRSHGVRLCVP
jgi:hypothetical protein